MEKKGYVSENNGIYYFHLLEEGADFLELTRSISIQVTDDFSMWEYQGSNHASDEAFVAPVDNADEAREVHCRVWDFE